MPIRTYLQDFSLANPLYSGATLTLYTVDSNGDKTSTKATLYADETTATTLGNPQTLDGDGKLAQPVYFDEAVIGEITGLADVTDHETGIIYPGGNYRGNWATTTVYYPGDWVTAGVAADGSNDIYRIDVRHTSGTFATDVSNSKLAKILDISDISQLPSPGSQATKIPRVNAGGTAYELRTQAEVLSDIGAAAAGHNHDADYEPLDADILKADTSDNLTVGFTTDVEADTFTNPLVPDLTQENVKTVTVTSDFTLNEPSNTGVCVFLVTVDSGGPYTMSLAANYEAPVGTSFVLSASTNYRVQVEKYGASNSVVTVQELT